MLKTRGLIQPVVKKSCKKPATVNNRKGIRSTGAFRIFKVLNP